MSPQAVPVHVGPEAHPLIVEAVERGGGELVEPADARAVVWMGFGSPDFGTAVHDGVEWVQLPSAGVGHWLDSGAIDGRRTFTAAQGAYAPTVAEHALALMLAGARRIPECVRATSWDQEQRFGRPLMGSSVAIVGCGGIGQELIGLLEPFGVDVWAVTRSGREVPGAAHSLPASEVGQVWPVADHVVIGAPATSETAHLVDAGALSAMREHAWLVNIARGNLIDTDALVDALDRGVIGGAALDVTDPEPLPDGHPLWGHPRAVVTPHVSNPPEQMMANLSARVEENVRRFAAGEDLLGVVDARRGY